MRFVQLSIQSAAVFMLAELLFLITIPVQGLASGPGQSKQAVKTIHLDIDVVQISDGARRLPSQISSRAELARLLEQNKAQLIASVSLRAEDGQRARTEIGKRVPIDMGKVTIAESPKASGRVEQTVASVPFGAPQIQYENTGLSVAASPDITPDGNISVSLAFSIQGIEGPTASLNPIFSERRLDDVFVVPDGSTTEVLDVFQGAPLAALAKDSVPSASGGRFVVLLTARIEKEKSEK